MDLAVVCIAAEQKDREKWKTLRKQVAKTEVRMCVGVGVEGKKELNRRGKSIEGRKKCGQHTLWKKNAEKRSRRKKIMILLIHCRSLNPQGKRLKEWHEKRRNGKSVKFGPPVNCLMQLYTDRMMSEWRRLSFAPWLLSLGSTLVIVLFFGRLFSFFFWSEVQRTKMRSTCEVKRPLCV